MRLYRNAFDSKYDDKQVLENELKAMETANLALQA